MWSLCPVQVLSTGASSRNVQTAVTGVASRSSATILSVQMTAVSSLTPAQARAAVRVFDEGLFHRQNGASTVVSSSSARLTGSVTSTSTAATATAAKPASTDLIQIGQYKCTSSIDFYDITEVLANYLSVSSDTLNASVAFLVLNLHAAAPAQASSNSSSPLSSSSLPGPADLLSSLINYNLSSYVYTPAKLQQDRADLDASWASISSVAPANTSYFNTVRSGSGVHSSPDGWPSEAYMELKEAMRLVVGFGDVDAQMLGYNFTGDSDTIFAAGATDANREIAQNSDGSLSSGCFFRAGQKTTVAQANNSWAVASQFMLPANSTLMSDTANQPFLGVSNVTACGISPLLNQSLGAGADQNIAPYQSLASSTVWAWMPGQPAVQNASNSNDGHKIRCAALDRSQGGRWRVADCAEHHRAACRVGGAPYTWRVSSTAAGYGVSSAYCGDGANFSAPRTGLENSFLLDAFQQSAAGREDDALLWVNFNSLEVQNCWVVGVNASCPYSTAADEDRRRTVIVPTVAAVIVFLLALLTIFVKCVANRQNSKKRKRRKGEGGWDYEGVPS